MHKSTILKLCLAATLGFSSQALIAKEEAPQKISKRQKVSLMDKSIVLSDRGKLALIPKGSILFIPKRLESKIATGKPKGTLVEWNKFLTLNSSWIHMYPVTFEQATGRAKIPQEQLEGFERLNKIVIARRGKNLISVSPKALEPEPEEEQ